MNGLAESLSEGTWRARLERHQSRVSDWANARRARAGIGKKHPVYDFLFEYYSFRPGQLLRWSPGCDVLLDGADHSSFAGASEFSLADNGLALFSHSFPAARQKYLEWAVTYLTRISDRPAQLSCFGLHEWAMVYKCSTPRYPDIPMRLSAARITEVCDSIGLRCTHYDAFRFFTPSARPLNALELSRKETSANDQPGCIHVSMDLYRFTYKIAPFIPAELTGDAFELAMAAREIDMRASPYDLEPWGFPPIKIEEVSGRAEYATLQLGLSQRAAPVRARIKSVYESLLAAPKADIDLQ